MAVSNGPKFSSYMGQYGLPITTLGVTQFIGTLQAKIWLSTLSTTCFDSQSPAASTHSTKNRNPRRKAIPTPTTPIRRGTTTTKTNISGGPSANFENKNWEPR